MCITQPLERSQGQKGGGKKERVVKTDSITSCVGILRSNRSID